jgi:hypothetical protein
MRAKPADAGQERTSALADHYTGQSTVIGVAAGRRATRRSMPTPPVEAGSRVSLPSWRDIVVPDHRVDRIASAQPADKRQQGGVLGAFKGQLVAALQLDSQRKVVAALASLPRGKAGMPGTLPTGNELYQLAVATNQEMRGDAQADDLREVRVGGRIQPIGKQPHNAVAAKTCRRQADRVDDDQRHDFARRARVTIWRHDMQRLIKPATRRHRRRAIGQTTHSSMPSRSMR